MDLCFVRGDKVVGWIDGCGASLQIRPVWTGRDWKEGRVGAANPWRDEEPLTKGPEPRRSAVVS